MNTNYPEQKRHEYWNHWVNYIFVDYPQGKPNGVTAARLRKVKPIIMNDVHIWYDVLDRHDGLLRTPEAMKLADPGTYDHMIGNFSGMVYQILIDSGVIKI